MDIINELIEQKNFLNKVLDRLDLESMWIGGLSISGDFYLKNHYIIKSVMNK